MLLADDDSGDPRLSWLEAFVATAKHLDFQLAADELGLTATSVRRSVEKLEAWLHKLLILDDGPLELYDVDGAQFLPVASDILTSIKSFPNRNEIDDRARSLAQSTVSGVRLSELESFLSIATHGNYKSSAYELQCSTDQLRRNVKKLEDVAGCELIAGRSVFGLTDSGREFLDVVNKVVDALRGSVADISKHDPSERHLRTIWNSTLKRSVELSLIIARGERKNRPTKLDIRQTQEAKEAMVMADNLMNELRHRFIRPFSGEVP